MSKPLMGWVKGGGGKLVWCCKLSLYANDLVMSIQFIFSDDYMMHHVHHISALFFRESRPLIFILNQFRNK